MADISAAALVSRDIDNSGPSIGRLWTSIYSVRVLWGAADTYPAGGIPLPALGAVGLQKAITRAGANDQVIYDDAGVGILAKYDGDLNTLRLYKSVQTVAGTNFSLKELAAGVAMNNAANGYGARTAAGQAALSITGLTNADVKLIVQGVLG